MVNVSTLATLTSDQRRYGNDVSCRGRWLGDRHSTMNFDKLIAGMRKAERNAEDQLHRIRAAIEAFRGIEGGGQQGRKGRRTMSAAARAKISAAQKARWKKQKSA